ncbi:hypothetical protein N8698_03125 [Candidatus Pelagibacter sp.]|nr:hypothetical protein [Candidatus Pelagibacter sp.]
MKYFLLLLILTSCSLNKNSKYWNDDSIKKPVKNKNLSKVLKKNDNFKIMTFDEFNLFLKDYSDKAKYPDINN